MNEMNCVFLDTTVQVARHVRQAEPTLIKEIENTLSRYDKSIASTYILKEFMARLAHDFIYSLNILRENCKLSYFYSRIYKLPPQWYRKLKICLAAQASFWCKVSDMDTTGRLLERADEEAAEKFKLWLKQAIEDLQDQFISMVDEITNETRCIYAEQKPISKKGKYEYRITPCNQQVMQCNILNFFKANQNRIQIIVRHLNSKEDSVLSRELRQIKEEFKYILKYPDRLFGLKKCKKVADAVIALEVPPETTFYSGNPKEAKPLCEALKVPLENVKL